jgi:hypothetical protein
VPTFIIGQELAGVPFLLLLAIRASHSFQAVWIWADFVVVGLLFVELQIAPVAPLTYVKMAAAPVGVEVVLVIYERQAMSAEESGYLRLKRTR